jgi:hypothetical protein
MGGGPQAQRQHQKPIVARPAPRRSRSADRIERAAERRDRKEKIKAINSTLPNSGAALDRPGMSFAAPG